MEDSPADAGLVREALQEFAIECELIVIRDGESAVEFIQSVENNQAPCPNLVILDLNIPKVPGREVLRCMRGSVKCGHVPVAVLTSSDNQRDREEAAQLGASLYLRKPSRLAEFIKLGGVFKGMLRPQPN